MGTAHRVGPALQWLPVFAASGADMISIHVSLDASSTITTSPRNSSNWRPCASLVGGKGGVPFRA